MSHEIEHVMNCRSLSNVMLLFFRYSYIVYIILKLLQTNTAIKVFYDVGCNLHRHFKRLARSDKTIFFNDVMHAAASILEQIQIAVPVWHSYAHTSRCQVIVIYTLQHE